jgi:para-aminobenzoate synthetase/4-amino-4-deoxychorismate lyase
MRPARPDPSLGVFETMLVRGRRVHALDAHLERLKRSVSELYGLDLPAGLRASIARAAERQTPHRLRIDAVPEDGRLRVELQTSPLPTDPASPVVLTPVVVPGGLGSHKWTDRRLVESLAPAAQVPLLVDEDGSVLEAGPANVWLSEAGRLVTPPTDGRILPGVTRDLLFELAPSHGLDARSGPISIERARSAAAIFLTSSLRLAAAASLDEPLSEEPALVATIRDVLDRSF